MKNLLIFFLGLFLLTGFFSNAKADIKPVVEIHGELEYEYSASNAGDIDPRFQLDKFVIQPKVKFGKHIRLSAQWYARTTKSETKDVKDTAGTYIGTTKIKEQKSFLNEFHVKFIGLPFDTWIDAGLYERAIKDHHSRKSEAFSLYGNAFYRDDALTISAGNWKKKHKSPPLYWIVSLSEGYGVGNKQSAEQTSKYGSDPSVTAYTKYYKDKMMQDDLDTKNDVKYPEVGLNLGYNLVLGGIKFDLMGFYYFDKMKDSEKSKFQGYLSSDQKTKLDTGTRDRYRTGAQLKGNVGNFGLFGAYLIASDMGLIRTSYVAELSYKLKTGMDFFKSITPLVSYSSYTIDGSSEFGIPESWDRSQIITSLIIEVIKSTKFKIEYVKSFEKTGGSGAGNELKKIDNDEFLVQLEVRF